MGKLLLADPLAHDALAAVMGLQASAARLDAELRDGSPQDVLGAALRVFSGRTALVSSFGAESAVLLHMAAQVDPALPVLFLETGMLFGQTLDYRKRLATELGLTNVRDIRPDPAELAVIDPKSVRHRTDVDACCGVRKVAPLERALGSFDAWITGRKRFHGGDRLRLPVVEFTDGRVKINPLANLTKAELDAYAAAHDLPPHPLVAFRYPSVGCWPCTSPADPGEDVRAGRWSGLDKTECGIHVARGHSPASDELAAVDDDN